MLVKPSSFLFSTGEAHSTGRGLSRGGELNAQKVKAVVKPPIKVLSGCCSRLRDANTRFMIRTVARMRPFIGVILLATRCMGEVMGVSIRIIANYSKHYVIGGFRILANNC